MKPLLEGDRGAATAIMALAHITGGGFPDNLPRVLPDGLARRARSRGLRAAAGVRLARRGRRRRRRPKCCAPSIAGSAWSSVVAAERGCRGDRRRSQASGLAPVRLGEHRRRRRRARAFAGRLEAVTARQAHRDSDFRPRLQHGRADRAARAPEISRRNRAGPVQPAATPPASPLREASGRRDARRSIIRSTPGATNSKARCRPCSTSTGSN